ncbi:hypothetical protein [Nocardia sp. NBC_01388]|uniref:hypothetical protein n=1 Tax=Nocardia sp. NBC_01388 TaxID=2903596 RepID=UPI003254FD35
MSSWRPQAFSARYCGRSVVSERPDNAGLLALELLDRIDELVSDFLVRHRFS